MNRSRLEWADFAWAPITGCMRECTACVPRKRAFCASIDVRHHILRPLLRCGKEHLADAAAVVFFQHAHDIEFRRIPPRFGKVKESDGVLAVERGEKRLLNTLFDVFLARLWNIDIF